MKRITALCAVICFATAFSLGCTHHHYKSAGICGAAGGLAGALINKKNPWRGAIIGAAISSVACATVTELSMQAAREAAAKNRPVAYRKKVDGNDYVVQANPIEHNPATGCKKIKNYTWEDGVLLGEYEDEICPQSVPANQYRKQKHY